MKRGPKISLLKQIDRVERVMQEKNLTEHRNDQTGSEIQWSNNKNLDFGNLTESAK